MRKGCHSFHPPIGPVSYTHLYAHGNRLPIDDGYGHKKTNSMVQTIATLIDETLMVMGAHLHVRMTDEEMAYLDAHFELIHIMKGEHLVARGEEVCYLYYLESGIVRLWFPEMCIRDRL